MTTLTISKSELQNTETPQISDQLRQPPSGMLFTEWLSASVRRLFPSTLEEDWGENESELTKALQRSLDANSEGTSLPPTIVRIQSATIKDNT